MPRLLRTSDVRGAVVVALVGLAGVVGLLGADVHDRHDPVHGLQQLDLLYLHQDPPALVQEALDRTVRPRGTPAVLVLCEGCDAPDIDVLLAHGPPPHVVVSDDPDLASAVLLRRADGAIGPGYVLIDAVGRLRYRTFDPGVSDHGREIAILLGGLR